MSEFRQPADPRRVPGKSLAIVVIVSLAAILLFVFWCVRSYDQLSEARRATDATWRSVAIELDKRYRGLENLVARGVDNRQIDMRWGERWRSALDHFRASSIPEAQKLAATEVEELIAQLPQMISADGSSEYAIDLTSMASSATSELDQAMTEHKMACLRERSLVLSLGGRLLDVVLVLRQPQELTIAPR